MPKAKRPKKSATKKAPVKKQAITSKRPAQKQPAVKAATAPTKANTVSPLFTLFCLCVFIGLLGLGTWQVKRMAVKNELAKAVAEKSNSIPLLLPTTFATKKEDLTFRPMLAGGFFLHDQEIVVEGKYLKNEQGAYVLTPLLLQDGSILMVNRGWVPKGKTDPKTRPESQSDMIQFLRGIGWVFDEPWRFLPKNQPDKNLWLWATERDVIAYLEQRNPGKLIYPVIFAQTDTVFGKNKDDLPIIPEKKIHIQNDHLQYAITWYVLALAIAGMYFIYRRGQR